MERKWTVMRTMVKKCFRIKDRQNREMLYGPTNEELVTDIFRSSVKSYKSLTTTSISYSMEI